MEYKITGNIGVAQIYLPAANIKESAAWYESRLGFIVQFENENFATLRHQVGPGIMLRKTSKTSPVLFSLEDREFPVVSLQHPDVEGLYSILVQASDEVGEIKRFGENGKYVHFHVKDPYGNMIDIGNYPDLG